MMEQQATEALENQTVRRFFEDEGKLEKAADYRQQLEQRNAEWRENRSRHAHESALK